MGLLPPTEFRLPRLYKHTERGAPQIWEIRVTPIAGDQHARITTTYGREGGKLLDQAEDIREGKNIGRKNETTPFEQAKLEATSRHTAQLERNHYGYTPEESKRKRDLAPMLAHDYPDYQHKVEWGLGQCHGQPKLDGHRCTARRERDGRIALYTRNGEEITTLPHIIDALAGRLYRHEEAIDGELYIHGEDLQKIGSLVRRRQPGTERIQYHVYDAFGPEPFCARIERVRSIVPLKAPDSPLRVVTTLAVRSHDDLLVFQRECIERGFEGAVLRHGPGGYEAGRRSQSLLKVKTFQDDEFLITGAKRGRGKFADCAVFECVTATGNPFDVTAPGTLAAKQQAWEERDRWIGRMLTVKYAGYTPTDKPVPFHPVAKGLRRDI